MSRLSLLTLSAALAGSVLVLPASRAFAVVSAPSEDPAGTSSQFTVTGQTEVPGKILKPGSYTIRIVDHLSDRMIVEVARDGKAQATFLALPVSRLPRPGATGPISVNGSTHGHDALRGFAFPNGTLAEFVFPKAEAVGIAKANSTTIPAIDPPSEGIPEAKNLSPKDMQMVTLWMLTPTTVGPNDQPAVSAARYQLPQGDRGGQQVAAVPAPARPMAVQQTPAPSTRIATLPVRQAAANRQIARADVPPRPVRVQPRALQSTVALPHTASDGPLLWLAGCMAALGAGLLSLRRNLATRA